MVDIVTLEIGQNVQFSVEMVLKPKQELALTLLQPMVVQIVLGNRLRLNLAKIMTVQV